MENENVAKPGRPNVEENNSSFIGRNVQKNTIYGKYTSEKRNLSGLLFFSIIVNIGLFVLLLFLGAATMFVYNGRNVSVVVPPSTIEDVTLVFGSTRVNKPVYEMYADYLSRSFGNVNYQNVDATYKNLAGYAASEKYHEVRRALAAHAVHIKVNMITQEFKLQRVDIESDSRGVLAKCYGFMSRKVGGRVQFEYLPYVIKFWLKPYHGNLMIMGMAEEIDRNSNGANLKKVEAYEQDNRYVNF